MTQERPKRKATANKNYLDIIPDSLLESSSSAHNSHLKNGSSATSSPSKNSYTAGASVRNRGRASNVKNSPGYAALLPVSSKSAQYGAKLPINWVPPVKANERFSHRLNLKDAFVDMEMQTLTCPNQPHIDYVASDSVEDRELQRLICIQTGQKNTPGSNSGRKSRAPFQLLKGDYIYMVSEPPGEPYYIGRLMGFHLKGKVDETRGPVDINANYEFLIQWFYRPRDISKNTTDLRLLYASMHSDTCPVSSFRGLLTVKHKLEVEKFYVPKLHGNAGESMSAVEYYTSLPNCFYFDKLFDRYMIKFYDIIKTSTLLDYLENETNNNKNYILALNKRYEYVFMEAARTKVFLNNFTSTMSTHCNICAEWCPAAESVTCSECNKHFHMLCLDPPLLKKPSRGFSWSCAICSKKHELEQLRKKILMLSHDNKTTNQDELSTGESLHPLDGSEMLSQRNGDDILPKYELCAIDYLNNDAETSVSERRLQEEWNIRYLGLHCRLEDAVDPDDRSPYPRASTSLGTKYQAINIPECVDHPIVYFDIEKDGLERGKSKKGPGGRKTAKRKSDAKMGRHLSIPPEFEDVPPSQYPSWLQARPKGYVERGEDDGEGDTCTLLWKSPERDLEDNFARHDAFVAACAPYAKKLDLHPNSPNFVDAIVKIYMEADGNTEKGVAAVKKLTRKSLKEPTLTKDEIKRFEAGVRKHGSEIFPISKEVKTQPCSALVRYYYIWKKTKAGQAIWGNFPGRKKKKNKESEMKIIKPGETCADSDDDSSYENDKIIDQKTLFKCKHCHLFVSEEWFKITGFDGASKHDTLLDDIPMVDSDAVSALCFRCAKLWRRYAVYWEDPLEVERKSTRGLGGYKRKVEAELIADSEQTLKHADHIGAVFCPETSKNQIQCSVISESALNKPQKLRGIPKPELQEILTTEAMNEKKPSRLTSRQLSLSAKEAAEKTVEPQKKKRKAEPKIKAEVKKIDLKTKEAKEVKVKVEPKIKVDSKGKRAEKTKGDKKADKATELKLSGDRKIELKNDPKKRSASVSKKESQKRKKKNSDISLEPKAKKEKSSTPKPSSKLTGKNPPEPITPVFNSLYVKPSSFRTLLSLPLASTLLRRVLTAFRIMQLANRQTIVENRIPLLLKKGPTKVTTPAKSVGVMPSLGTSTGVGSKRMETENSARKPKSLMDSNSAEKKKSQVSTSLALTSPSSIGKPGTTSCTICLQHDIILNDLMACATCGTAVHGSCIGVNIPKHAQPVRHWQCEMCMNEMKAMYGREYRCCLCPDNIHQKTHYSHNGFDHLIPIVEIGQWCHILCASFNFRGVIFKNAPSMVDSLNEGTRYSGIVVESIALTVSQSTGHLCSICGHSGGLVECVKCLENEPAETIGGEKTNERSRKCTRTHVTCAQRASGYEVGLRFSKNGARVGAIAYSKSHLGRLVPSIICDKHEKDGLTYSLRALGNRTPTAENRPLFALFLEDLRKSSLRGAHGPQLRSQNYLNLIKASIKKPEKETWMNEQSATILPKKCRRCKIDCSPKWWAYDSPTVETVTGIEKASTEVLNPIIDQGFKDESGKFSTAPIIVDQGEDELQFSSKKNSSPNKNRQQSYLVFSDSSTLSATVGSSSGKLDSIQELTAKYENTAQHNPKENDHLPFNPQKNDNVSMTPYKNLNTIRSPVDSANFLAAEQPHIISEVSSLPRKPSASSELAAFSDIITTRVARPVGEYLCHKCHSTSPVEVIEISDDDEGSGDTFLAELSQPLSCPQLGLNSPSDRIHSVYKKTTSN